MRGIAGYLSWRQKRWFVLPNRIARGIAEDEAFDMTIVSSYLVDEFESDVGSLG